MCVCVGGGEWVTQTQNRVQSVILITESIELQLEVSACFLCLLRHPRLQKLCNLKLS